MDWRRHLRNGAEARELLALYYQVKGLPEVDALKVVEHIAAKPDQFLRALSAERLNSTEEALSNPVVSALSGALSTAVGAFIPVVPFFFMSGYRAVIWAAIISLLAHFAVGAAKSLITARSWWSSGIEMTIVGAIEGVVTFVIGIGIGRIAGQQLSFGDQEYSLPLPVRREYSPELQFRDTHSLREPGRTAA